MPLSPRHMEFGLLGVLALLWGSSYLFIRIALEGFPPVTLIAVRVTIAALFLMAVLRWQGEALPRGRAVWRALLLQAFLNSIGAWTLLAWGQQHVASALASVLNSTSPMFVVLIGALVLRHGMPPVHRIAGAVLGLLGVVLIMGAEALEDLGEQITGQIAILTSAVLYACAAINGRRFALLSPVVTAAGTMIWASLFLVPASLVLDRPWALDPPLEALGAAMVLGVACTGIALLIYFRLVHTLGALGVASQSYLRAGVGVVLGAFVLGETITPLVGLGILAAILGVTLINWPARAGLSKRASGQ